MFQLNEKLTQGSVLIGSNYIQSWYTECPDNEKNKRKYETRKENLPRKNKPIYGEIDA